MKQKRLVPLGFFAMLILGIAIVSMMQFKNSIANDVLVVWGKYNDECLIWTVDPKINKPTSPINGYDTCNYMFSDIDGSDNLIHVQSYPGEVSIYTVSKKGVISLKETINVEEIQITSSPQWGQEQFMYISGIKDDSEQIYRVDTRSGEIIQLTHIQDGMAHAPSLSPDGKYLAYLVFTQAANSIECYMCLGQYYVMEITAKKSIELNPLVMRSEVPFFDHCLATWSPNSMFLAFSLGCEAQDPQELVVFDVLQSQVAVKLGQDDAVGLPTIEGWLTDNELVYSSATDFTLDPVGQLLLPSRRYYVHSLAANSTSELGEFPLIVSTDKGNSELFYLTNVSWTQDGKHLVGIAGSPQQEELVISDLDNRPSLVRNTYLHNTNPQVRSWRLFRVDPAWSLSGNWIAYSSTDNGINIVSKTGDVMYELDIPAMSEYGFAWVQP